MTKLLFFLTLINMMLTELTGNELCRTTSTEIVLKNIEESIEEETKKIDSFHYSSTEEVLELYNERGISHFAGRKYDLALADFNHILEVKFSENRTYDLLVGAALWGRALCHACLDMPAYAIQDIDLLKSYFAHQFHRTCECKAREIILNADLRSQNHDFIILPIVKFANPDEKISAAECRNRVTGSAEKLRLFVGPLIKDTAVRIVFYTFINALEDQGIYCCKDGSLWTSCVSPLLEKLEKWKLLGIPADPAWD